MKSEQNFSDCQYSFILLVHLGIVLFVIALYVAGVATLHADTSHIQNNISVTSNTGGNSANGRAGTNGTSTSSVYIKQTINGRVIEEIDETIQSNDASTSIRVESTYENGNKETKIEVSPDPAGVSRTETIRVQSEQQELQPEVIHTPEEVHEASSVTHPEIATPTEHLTRKEKETNLATTTPMDNSDQIGVWHSVSRFFASVLTYVSSLFTESHRSNDPAIARGDFGVWTSIFKWGSPTRARERDRTS